MNIRSTLAGCLATAVVLATAMPVLTRLETVRRVGFCLPAAAFAASVLGAPYLTDHDGSGYTIPVKSFPVHVVLECSAVRYFCVTAAILAGLCVERRRIGMAFLMFPMAYALTIIANTARIVCGWQAQRLAVEFLPADDLAAIHMGVGAACFIAFLIIAYSLIERSLTHGQSKVAAS